MTLFIAENRCVRLRDVTVVSPHLPAAARSSRRMLLSSFAVAVFCLTTPREAYPHPADEKRDDSSDEPVYDLGPGITPPKVTHQVLPSHAGKGFRLKGNVLIGLVVTSKGAPDKVKVIRGLDPEVDQTAVDAVKEWRFLPAKKEDKPVAVHVSVEIRFNDL
jgi:TonB family protein